MHLPCFLSWDVPSQKSPHQQAQMRILSFPHGSPPWFLTIKWKGNLTINDDVNKNKPCLLNGEMEKLSCVLTSRGAYSAIVQWRFHHFPQCHRLHLIASVKDSISTYFSSLAAGWAATSQRSRGSVSEPPEGALPTCPLFWDLEGHEWLGTPGGGEPENRQGSFGLADTVSSFHSQDMPLCGQERVAGSGRLEEMISALNIVTVAHSCLGEQGRGNRGGDICESSLHSLYDFADNWESR